MKKTFNISWLTLAITLAVAASSMAMRGRMPLPGLVNSVQGHVRLGARSVTSSSISNRALRPHEVLATQHGNAEVLLTPGAFLRLGHHSAARMLSRSLENSQVRLIKGKALLRADTVFKGTLSVVMDGATARIDRKGLYGFNARRETIGVLRGKATVYKGGSRFTLKKGRELALRNGLPLGTQKLDKQAFESGQLFRWSRLRDRFEFRARQSARQAIAQSGRWQGRGWYWSPYWGFYTYLPSEGMYYGPYSYPYGWNEWGWGEGWGGWGDDDD